MRAHLLALAGLGLAACVDTRAIPTPNANEGDLLVLALVEGGGRVLGVRSAIYGGPNEVASIADAGDGTTVVFAVAVEDFLTADGQAIDASFLSKASAWVEGTGPRDGCGRCLAPSHRSPQTVFPGDRCVLPAFARTISATRDEVNLLTDDGGPLPTFDRERRQIRLAFPGECPFDSDPTFPLATEERRYQTIYPEKGMEAFVHAAIAPDGTFGLFNEREIRLYRPDGTEASRRVELKRRVRMAAGIGDATFVVGVGSSRGETELLRVSLTVAEEIMVEPLSTDRDIAIDPYKMIPLKRRSVGGTYQDIAIIGKQQSFGSSITTVDRCRVEASSVVCSRLSPDNLLSFGGNPFDARSILELEDDLLIVTANDRPRLGVGRASTPGNWRHLRLDDHLQKAEIEAEGHTGSRLFVCGQDKSHDRRIVLTASVTESILNPEEPDPEWEFLTTVTACSGFFTVEADSIRLVSGRTVDTLSSDGDLVGTETTQEVFGIDTNLEDVLAIREGWIAVRSGAGAHFQNRAPGGLQLAHRHGPGIDHPEVAAIVPKEDDPGVFWVFWRGGQFGLMSATDGLLGSVQLLALPQEPDDHARAAAAAFDNESQTIIVSGKFALSGAGWLGRLDPDTGDLERIPSGVISGWGAVKSITEASPGEHLLLGDGMRAAVLRGAELQAVDIDWDDHETDKVEERPSQCFQGFVGGRATYALEVDNGVGWAVGCGLSLIRLTRSKTGWRGERVGVLEDEAIEVEPLSAIHTMSPADILAASQGVGAWASEETGALRVIRAGAPNSSRSDGLEAGLRKLSHLDPIGESNGTAAAIVTTPAGPVTLVLSRGDVGAVWTVGSEVTYRYDFPFLDAVIHPLSREVLIGAAKGWVVAGSALE